MARLDRIVTRSGDDGTTGLADGSRLRKDAPRIEAIGEVDELNCLIGIVLAEPLPAEVRDTLQSIQHDLFELGGELATPSGHARITGSHLARLETQIGKWNATLSSLEEFILPGGSRPSALCHAARAVCRRAERRVVSLAENRSLITQYLNRLSDLLFVAARILNRHEGCDETSWLPGKSR